LDSDPAGIRSWPGFLRLPARPTLRHIDTYQKRAGPSRHGKRDTVSQGNFNMGAIEKIKSGLSPKAQHVVSRLSAQMQRVKEESKRVTEVGVSSVVTVAGGAAAGALAAKMPTVPGSQVPSDIALGAGCVMLAMIGAGGKNNEHLASFGAGVLAVRAAKETEKALKS
jgi:hypothetical protein